MLYAAWRASSWRAERRLRAALRDPERAQQRVVARILASNLDSRYGRRHGFHRLHDAAAFEANVPLTRYEDYLEDIELIRQGRAGVLTSEPVRRLVPTSGSTSGAKLIPFTAGLSAQLNAAVGPWLSDMLRQHPQLNGGPAYWSVSPALGEARHEAPTSRVPVGFASDAAYLGSVLAPVVQRTLIAPASLRHARSMQAFQYATLRVLLQAADLRLISVWHPSFLSLLLDLRAEYWDELVADIASGELRGPAGLGSDVRQDVCRRLPADPRRAATLRSLGPEAPLSMIWPRLTAVSAWADAMSAGPFRALQQLLPGVALLPKGLLATEGCISVPYGGDFPLAVTSHYIELIDERGKTTPLTRAQVGAQYEIAVTTAGGLYRYQLGDRVRVVGHMGRTPCVRFVGRSHGTVDQVGEKLSEAFVSQALDTVFEGQPGELAMLAPVLRGGRPAYVLFSDRAPRDSGTTLARLSAELRRNPYYAQARDLGQLGPERLYITGPTGPSEYLRRLGEQGRRIGDIKPTALSPLESWDAHFNGAFSP